MGGGEDPRGWCRYHTLAEGTDFVAMAGLVPQDESQPPLDGTERLWLSFRGCPEILRSGWPAAILRNRAVRRPYGVQRLD